MARTDRTYSPKTPRTHRAHAIRKQDRRTVKQDLAAARWDDLATTDKQTRVKVAS